MICALVEHHSENLIAFRRRLVHLAHLLCVYASGFFRDNVELVRERLDDKRGMIVVRGRDDHRIAQPAVKKRGC